MQEQVVSTAPATPPAKPKRSTKRTVLSVALIVVLIPLCIVLTSLGDVSYYVTSVVVIILCMVPFFVSFEDRKPQARELVIIAVLTALAVVSRAVFIWLPAFKPMVAIIMIAGIGLGSQAGFITGALAAFVSNFIFGQGPWTPWQMFAFAIGGFVAGLLADFGVIPRGGWSVKRKAVVSACAFVFVVCIVGPLLDTCTLFTVTSMPGPNVGAAAIYLSGIPVNVIHGLAVAVTLFLAANPLLDKLSRVKTKYGMME